MTANWSLQSLGRGWRFGSVGPWSDANLSCPQSQFILQFGIWTYGNDGWMAISLQRLLDSKLVWTAFLCIQGSRMSSWAGTVKDRWCTGTFATWPTLTRLRKRCTRRKVSLKICAVVYWLLAQISSFFSLLFSFFFFLFSFFFFFFLLFFFLLFFFSSFFHSLGGGLPPHSAKRGVQLFRGRECGAKQLQERPFQFASRSFLPWVRCTNLGLFIVTSSQPTSCWRTFGRPQSKFVLWFAIGQEHWVSSGSSVHEGQHLWIFTTLRCTRGICLLVCFCRLGAKSEWIGLHLNQIFVIAKSGAILSPAEEKEADVFSFGLTSFFHSREFFHYFSLTLLPYII